MKTFGLSIITVVLLSLSARPANADSVSVSSSQARTDSGIALTVGEQVTITASGTAYVGVLSNPAWDNETPNGQP